MTKEKKSLLIKKENCKKHELADVTLLPFLDVGSDVEVTKQQEHE